MEKTEKLKKQWKVENIKKKKPWNSRAKKYSNWTEQFNRELQKQTRHTEEKSSNLEDKAFEIIQSEGKTGNK